MSPAAVAVASIHAALDAADTHFSALSARLDACEEASATLRSSLERNERTLLAVLEEHIAARPAQNEKGAPPLLQ